MNIENNLRRSSRRKLNDSKALYTEMSDYEANAQLNTSSRLKKRRNIKNHF